MLWSLSIHPENIKKPLGFQIFSGGMETHKWHGMSLNLGQNFVV